MPEFYIFDIILLINLLDEIGEIQLSVLATEGAKFAPYCT